MKARFLPTQLTIKHELTAHLERRIAHFTVPLLLGFLHAARASRHHQVVAALVHHARANLGRIRIQHLLDSEI